MKRLGVLVLSEPRNGGTYQYALSMLEALKLCNGLKITLYTNFGNSYYDSVGFPIHYVKASQKNWIKLFLLYLARGAVKDPFEQEDLVLAPMHSPLLLLTRKPFVYTLHDLQEYYFPENFSIAQRIWRRIINSLLTKKAHTVICESQFVKKDIKSFFGLPDSKIVTITAPPVTGISDKYSRSSAIEIKAKYNLPDHYLFYPAQFWPHKNHLRLIEAFHKIANQFPNVNLVLTGNKQEQFKNVFKRVENLGLVQRVIHIGYVDQLDLPAIYSSATVLVMPSLFESVSIPIYEAFQYEVPVCSSNVVALPEQVGDAGLLFNPISSDEISEAISKLLSSERLRSEFAKAGKVRLSRMTREKYAGQLEALINEVKLAKI